MEPSLIATNFHVIQGAKEVKVEFLDGTTIEVEGFLVASPGYDLAVLRLAEDAPCAPLTVRASDSDIGIDVFAVGNPKGLTGSVSKGVISARRRLEELRPLLKDGLHDFGYEIDSTWVQTDAAINSGNSGGPLCLADGTVIAINTWGTTPRGGQNLNFAIDASHLVVFLGRLPKKSSLLSALPPGPPAKAAPPSPTVASLERTQEYWQLFTKQLGTCAVQQQKLRNVLGVFKLKQQIISPPQEKVAEPWKTDPAFGPNLTARNVRMRGLADDAQIPYVKARRMTFAELGAAVAQKREKKLAERLEVAKLKETLQLMQTADGQEFLDFLAASAAASTAKKAADYTEGISQTCRKTAAALDSIPIDGVHPAVVSFAIDLATAYRSTAIDADEATIALRQQASGGSASGTSRAVKAYLASVSELIRLHEVQGNDLRLRLRNYFGADFGPVVPLTAEEEKLFIGESVRLK